MASWYREGIVAERQASVDSGGLASALHVAQLNFFWEVEGLEAGSGGPRNQASALTSAPLTSGNMGIERLYWALYIMYSHIPY